MPPTLQNYFVYLGNDDGKWEFESRLNLVFMMEKLFHHRQIIIYTHTRHLAERLCEQLYREKIKFVGPNEDITPFQEARINVLVAMDGLSRGIDFEAVALVLNFTLPADKETWVHRVGRAARRGLNGVSMTLFASKEVTKVESVCATYKIPLQQRDMSYNSECCLDLTDKTFLKMCDHIGVSKSALFQDEEELHQAVPREDLISVDVTLDEATLDEATLDEATLDEATLDELPHTTLGNKISPNALLMGPSEAHSAEVRKVAPKEKNMLSPEEQLDELMEQVNQLKAIIASNVKVN